MTKLIMGIGIPGSGKTMLLREFATKHNYAYICPDDIRTEITGNPADQTKNELVWQTARERLTEQVVSGETVVFDATFANAEQRKNFINFAREKGADKVAGVFIDVPLETAQERNQNRDRVVPSQVLERMDSSLRNYPPEIADGFDSLFTLNAEHELVSAELYKENESGESRVVRKEWEKW